MGTLSDRNPKTMRDIADWMKDAFFHNAKHGYLALVVMHRVLGSPHPQRAHPASFQYLETTLHLGLLNEGPPYITVCDADFRIALPHYAVQSFAGSGDTYRATDDFPRVEKRNPVFSLTDLVQGDWRRLELPIEGYYYTTEDHVFNREISNPLFPLKIVVGSGNIQSYCVRRGDWCVEFFNVVRRMLNLRHGVIADIAAWDRKVQEDIALELFEKYQVCKQALSPAVHDGLRNEIVQLLHKAKMYHMHKDECVIQRHLRVGGCTLDAREMISDIHKYLSLPFPE